MKNKSRKMVLIVGVDGVGKSTIAESVIKKIRNDGLFVDHIWSRYRNYISKPFLALMRLTGHNYKEVKNGVKIGYHEFSDSRLIAYTFLVLQWVDQVIDILLRFKIGNANIVSDRCVVDTLVDLAIDTSMKDFIFGIYGKSLIWFLPKEACFFYIKRDSDDVIKDRPDVLVDKHYCKRVELYNELSERLNLNVIYNNRSLDEAADEILLTSRNI